MKTTDQTLLEQMRITDFEISNRMRLFSIGVDDIAALTNAKPYIETNLDNLVNSFYVLQTAVPEIALLIGDADTLGRLHNAQRRYILDLFRGYYDAEYVNNRLRIGLVHKRIGVEPRLYLAAIQTLKDLLFDLIEHVIPDDNEKTRVIAALQKLMMFDISLVFDTYIRSLVSEIEIAKQKSDQYASVLEEKIKERTMQLEILSRTDALTGLLNVRYLSETLVGVLRSAQRRNEPVTVAYIDVNDFKIVNDTQGHQRGDEILRNVASVLRSHSRLEDYCFRYGGDEFCIVMPNCTVQFAQEAWEARIQQFLAKEKDGLSLSFGYAQAGPEEYVSAEELIRLADEHMYMDKKQRKCVDEV